jgi:hypothetical protein
MNPFVQSGLDIIVEHGAADMPEHQLIKALKACEPMLSPLNLQCAAREASRLAEGYLKRLEADGRAEETAAMPAQ